MVPLYENMIGLKPGLTSVRPPYRKVVRKGIFSSRQFWNIGEPCQFEPVENNLKTNISRQARIDKRSMSDLILQDNPFFQRTCSTLETLSPLYKVKTKEAALLRQLLFKKIKG